MCSTNEGCSSLNRLSLDNAIEQLSDDNNNILKLELLDAKIDDDGAKKLATVLAKRVNKTLVSLYLNANKIGDDGVESLLNVLKGIFIYLPLYLYLYLIEKIFKF
jgi:hypothetical protein